jgi:hypothetical protein
VIKAIFQHTLGITGQVASVLPLFIVTVYLTRTISLEAAGLFTILVGVSAAAYSSLYWALRTSILMDRFETVGPKSYFVSRIIALVLAAAITSIVGAFYELPVQLIVLLIALKSCDGLLDLRFATTQLWESTEQAISQYAALHLTKVGIVIGAALLAFLVHETIFTTAATIGAAILFVVMMVRLKTSIGKKSLDSETVTMRSLRSVVVTAAWFAISATICALLTSSPRIALGWLYSGDLMGVVGVSLSVSTFFGMAFYTTWVRHVSNFAASGRFAATALRFMSENVIVAVLAFAAAWFVLPPFVAWVFDFSAELYVRTAQTVLAASVVFFAAMNMCNLYKPTSAPWLEAVSYLLALVVATVVAWSQPQFREIEALLLIAACTMFTVSLGAFAILPKSTEDCP